MAEPLRLLTTHASMLTDPADLDAAFRDGPHDVLRRAYDRHGPLVYTFCRRSVGAELANDVTQEVFITAWRQRHRFDPERGVLAGWLVGIARNKVLETLRRRQLHLIDDHDAAAPEIVSPDSVGALADRMLLADALGELPVRMQRLISMAFHEELTHAEIAARTGLPLGTVKSDIRRGLERLRRCVDRADD
ncbi:MAG: sigma-70 family RNA polymerase sigma factor [Actinomycetota bacterium]|nr:sigma-70 family RNA polymerase sigma factor [Actinomycetota bacterium]